ncbi:metabotropic glutamate receptor 1-like [Asterias rubens]|uniref:metabotropic glutamate receptor 1-like n=1 Tax=Asterias rubens TaxID=7604 RepID=UPI0014557663|nr:metabotropic glutamate receptor 1-like [Asterias rubens]
MEAFKTLAKKAGVCIATADSIASRSSDRKFDKVIRNLLKTDTAKVVVCFCEGETITNLLKATRRLGESGTFLFIGSDGWANRYEIIREVQHEAIGGITIKPKTSYINDFDSYYFSLRPENHSKNPWFREFWQHRFQCQLPKGNVSEPRDDDQKYARNCTGNESLADEDYNQDTKMGFIINAIYTMAHGLHDMHRAVCPPDTVGLCPEMNPVDGRVFLKHLFNVSFDGVSGDRIQFDSNGDPTGRYDIFNYQLLPTGQYEYVRIGDWSAGTLYMNDSAMMWNNASSSPASSFCSEPCLKGHAKDIRDNLDCCWACVPCKPNEFMLDEFTCEKCEQGKRPNEELTSCVEIEVEYMKWGDIEAVFGLSFSCIGIALTFFVLFTFIHYNDTPVVKSSSRENSYILLAGILLCFSMTFVFIAVPNTVVCYIRRIGLGLSFCICYAALVVRTNRMARILAGSKKKIITRKPRFLSSTAQVVMTLLVIAVQVGIITALLLIEPPAAVFDYPDLHRVTLVCNTTTMAILAPLGYDALLVIMCTLYAFKTRNLPENFNEAKYIAFTMYTTCVVWLAFIPLYFGGNAGMRTIVVCFAVSLSATVTLGCLFFPKTYIVLFKPERNRRSSMKTSSLVRMHVGSFSELAPLSSQKSNSANGTLDKARDRGARSPGFNNRRKSSKEKGFFGGLRRRKQGYNQVMKAVERDRIQRRRQPVYRYSSSTETHAKRLSGDQPENEDGVRRASDQRSDESSGRTSQYSPKIAVVRPQTDQTATTLKEVYRESALRDSSGGSVPRVSSTEEIQQRRQSAKSSDSVFIAMTTHESDVDDPPNDDGRPLLTASPKRHSGSKLHTDIPQIITSFHGSNQDLSEPQVGQMRNSLDVASNPKRRVSDCPDLPRPGSNPFHFLPRRRSQGSLEGKPGVALCSAPPCKHSLKHRKQLARSAEVLCRQNASTPLKTSSTISSFSVSPTSNNNSLQARPFSRGDLLFSNHPQCSEDHPSPQHNTSPVTKPVELIELKNEHDFDRAPSKVESSPCQTPPVTNTHGHVLFVDTNQPCTVWNEAKLEELAAGQNTPLRTLPEIRSSNV